MLACVDGAIGPAEQARVPVTDDGPLRGDGAFEGLRRFWVRDGKLLTPPLKDRIFVSITRARRIDVAGATEAPTTLETLRGATEAFLASSVREVQPVAGIDDLRLTAAPGPVTLKAHEALRQAIQRELSAGG